MSTVDALSTTAQNGLGRSGDNSGATARRRPSIEPELVRVSVLGGNTQLDVGLPAGVPVAALIPDLVAQIESRSPSPRDPDDPDGDNDRPADRARRWTLALVGQEPVALHRSLSEAGIRDGDLLVLRSVRTGEAPVLFDDVVDAVARLNESHFANWSATAARYAGYAVALVAAVAAAAALAAIRGNSAGLWPAGISALTAVGFLVAATTVSRHYHDAATSTVLAAAAMPLFFVTGMLATPGSYGSAHLALGCAVTLVAVIVSYRVTTVGPITHSAITTATVLAGIACTVQMLFSPGVTDVAAVLAAVGVLVIGLAPRATIMLAKLPLPPVPTAGAPVDTGDMEPKPAIEGIGAIGAMALPKADALERRSYIANAYLSGIVGGTVAVTAVAAVLTAAPLSGFSPRAAVYAAIIGAVLCLRGRSHSDLRQAALLIAGGAATLIALATGLAYGADNWPVIGFGVAVLIVIGALLFGVVAPHQEFSPPMRRAAELFEYLLVAVIVPLLLWILNLYQIIREI